jgi:ribosomal L10-like protein
VVVGPRRTAADSLRSRTAPGCRDGRSLIRRTGPAPPSRWGRGRRRARRGSRCLHLIGGRAPASRSHLLSGGRHGIRRRGSRSDPVDPPPHAGDRVPKTGGQMPTEAKEATVAELREELAKARTMIVSEYRGLTVKEIAEIRRALTKQDVKYRVVKNRLMRIAAADTVGGALDPLLTGPMRRRRPRPSSTPPGRTTGSSGSRAASLATARSTPTPSPDSRRSPRARSSWPSWLGGCRRRSERWPDCSPRRCATWAMPSRRSRNRSARPRPRPSPTRPSTPIPKTSRRYPWLPPFRRTTCSRPSTR